jgi:hypothetical protein
LCDSLFHHFVKRVYEQDSAYRACYKVVECEKRAFEECQAACIIHEKRLMLWRLLFYVCGNLVQPAKPFYVAGNRE